MGDGRGRHRGSGVWTVDVYSATAYTSDEPLHLECSCLQLVSVALLPETAQVASVPVSHHSNAVYKLDSICHHVYTSIPANIP